MRTLSEGSCLSMALQRAGLVTSGLCSALFCMGVLARPVSAVGAEGASDQAGPPDRGSYLVHLQPGADKGLVRAFANQRGGVLKHEYNTVLPDVVNVRHIPEAAVAALQQVPGVVRVEEDEYHPDVLMLHDSMPLIRGLQSQITAAGLSANGAGVRICIVDTGIDSDHIMYSTRIDTAAGYDFYNDDSNPEDDHGHGSHCSGIAAGRTGLSWDPCGTGAMPFQGVAPEATLIGVKVLNQNGGGYDSDIIAGINYCADQSPSGARADVISMSIGTGSYSGPCTHSWAVAANNAVANGVVAVAASGNENYSNALSSPACGVNVIAVGMTWKNDYPTCEDPTTNWNWGICIDFAPQTDDVGCFSNESDYLDVTAPGANIWSASIAAGGGSITGMSGTSMSCPHVAGLAALILDADPTLTPAEVRQIIRDGAIDLGPAGFDRAYGYGRIDVINSLQLVGPGCSVPADCDDGVWCNGAEDCVSGNCVAGTAPDCSDGVACTTDACNEGTDSCDHTPDNGYCNNGLYCDGTESCHLTLGCQAGTAVDCADAFACTADSCNEGTDSCDHVPNNGLCADGLFCNGAEVCSVSVGCQAGSDPCPGQLCDEGADTCVDCFDSGDCDDGLWCNGAETCIGGACQAGSDPCPGQGCDEEIDDCVTLVCDGDGECEAGEDCNNCSNDCISGGGTAYCGDGICQPSTGEDCLSCASDCRGKQVGATKGQYCCGDGAGTNPVGCDNPLCITDPWMCSDAPADPYCCGDGFCEGEENYTNCAIDCPVPYCGDLNCDPGEDQCSCPGDCGTPPATETNCSDGVDNDCDGYTDLADSDCDCLPSGAACAANAECCSGSCHPVKRTCK